jgi:hypothetical protein
MKRRTTRKRKTGKATRSRKRAPQRRRRAPSRAPTRRRRSNPKGFIDQPAVRLGAAAGVGAVGALVLNARETSALDAWTMEGKMPRSTVAALIVLFGGWMALKGKNRAYALALGVGMLVPQATKWVTEATAADDASGSSTGSSTDALTQRRRQRRLSGKASGASKKNRASLTAFNTALSS